VLALSVSCVMAAAIGGGPDYDTCDITSALSTQTHAIIRPFRMSLSGVVQPNGT